MLRDKMFKNDKLSLDEIDKKILSILQKDSRIPVSQIADNLKIPKATVYYRIKRLEKEGVIKGYYAQIDESKVGKDFVTVTLIRAKYGPKYHEELGEALAKVPGVKTVYFVFGETDFVIITRSSDKNDFLKKLEHLMAMNAIERTNTLVVAKVLKDDPRVDV